MTEKDVPAAGGEQTGDAVQAGIGRVLEALEEGRAQDALAATKDLLDQFPDHPQPYHMLGVLLLKGGRPDQAAESLRRAVALDDRLPGVHYNLGLALSALGRADEALAEFEEAIALKPEHADAHTQRAKLLAALGRHGESAAGWKQAATLRPDDPETWVGAARALEISDGPAAALAWLEGGGGIEPLEAERVRLAALVSGSH